MARRAASDASFPRPRSWSASACFRQAAGSTGWLSVSLIARRSCSSRSTTSTGISRPFSRDLSRRPGCYSDLASARRVRRHHPRRPPAASALPTTHACCAGSHSVARLNVLHGALETADQLGRRGLVTPDALVEPLNRIQSLSATGEFVLKGSREDLANTQAIAPS